MSPLKSMRLVLIALLGFLQSAMALAESEDTFQFFQEEAKVAIAAQREQTPEEAPSIVSVITRADIERYGARDLADILRMVPGFEFGADVFSETGLSFRGIWVQEGKSLLMIDGVTQNELGYGNYAFLGSIPASMIERVEIIRGPGSALYGGFAEADVINVITHQPENLAGMRVSGDVGAVGNGGFSRYGNISYGNQTDALRVAASVGYGQEPLSERTYTDFYGNSLKLNDDTAYRQWQHIITEASAKNLTVRYQRTSFTFGGQDVFGTVQPPLNGVDQEQINNYNDVTHLDYQAKISDRLTLQPLFEFTRNNTWNVPFPAAVGGLLEGSGVTLWRYRGEMTGRYETPWSAHVTFGGGFIEDGVDAVAADGTPGLQLSSNPNDLGSRVHTDSAYGLLQYLQQMDPFGLTLGGRYEDTTFGRAFAPRTGLTYVHEAFNAKLLYSSAYRIPLPMQAYSRLYTENDQLRPETANTTELELGYKLTPHLTAKINTFLIDILNPIIYEGTTNSYSNFGRFESEGAEGELRLDYGRYGGFANISYATPGPDTSQGLVNPSKTQFLATPPVKLNLGTYYRVGNFEVAPSLTYLAHRVGQSSESANDPNNTLGTTDYPALLLANLNFVFRNVLKDFDLHLAIHNMFNASYVLIEPYYGDHAPMPAQDREIDLGVTWHL
jgi:outer membrane cobalamin receptor